MAALAARAPSADRGGAEPVRRAAGTGRAPTPPWPGGPKSGRRRPGAQRSPQEAWRVTGESCAAPGQRTLRAALTKIDGQPGARRAPRAFKDVEKVLTGLGNEA